MFSYSTLKTSLVTQMVKRLPTMRETRVQSLGQEDLLEKGMATHSSILASPAPHPKKGLKEILGFPGPTQKRGSKKYWASLVAQRLKHLPAMWETWVRSLGREDPLEKEMATHSSILAWRVPWTEEPGGLQSMGLQRSQIQLSNFTFYSTLNL